MTAGRWAAAAAVPALAFVVGVIALPRPGSVADPKADGDATLADVIKKEAPRPTHPLDVTLGDDAEVRFLGADLPKDPVEPGAELAVTFYFAADGALDRDWQIFLHVDSKAASYRIHGDHFPAGGRAQTTLWEPGAFIIDKWRKPVPRDAPSGAYDIWLGLYIAEERMAVAADDRATTDGQDRIRVGTVVVK